MEGKKDIILNHCTPDLLLHPSQGYGTAPWRS